VSPKKEDGRRRPAGEVCRECESHTRYDKYAGKQRPLKDKKQREREGGRETSTSNFPQKREKGGRPAKPNKAVKKEHSKPGKSLSKNNVTK